MLQAALQAAAGASAQLVAASRAKADPSSHSLHALIKASANLSLVEHQVASIGLSRLLTPHVHAGNKQVGGSGHYPSPRVKPPKCREQCSHPHPGSGGRDRTACMLLQCLFVCLSLSLSDTWVGERRVSCGSSRSWRTHEENSTDCTSSATRKALVDVHKVNRPKQTIHSTLGRDGKPCHVSFLHLINFQCTNELGFFRLQLLFLEGKERREVGGSLV